MASLNGVSIKNVKEFMGMDAPGCQATVYLNGRKLGFWSDSGNGGCHDFDFNVDVLKESIYKAKSTLKGSSKEYYNADSFMVDVLVLTLLEKEYRKLFKKGYPFLLGTLIFGGSFAYNAIGYKMHPTEAVYTANTKELLLDIMQYANGEDPFVKLFKTVDEFDIQLGSDSGLQEEKKAALKEEEKRKKEYEKEKKRRKLEEDKFKNNGRFIVADNVDASVTIQDKKSKKSVIVPLHAYKDVMRVLVTLFTD